MDIFDFAMKMETDGRNYYLENADKTNVPQLKSIFLQMADDELKHYEIFKALRDGALAEYDESRKTTILSSAKNVFETLKSEGSKFSFDAGVEKIWEQARDVEKKAEAFYREKANEVTDERQKHILNRIADEEHHHWVTLDHVIKFLRHPETSLEDAEWSSSGDY